MLVFIFLLLRSTLQNYFCLIGALTVCSRGSLLVCEDISISSIIRKTDRHFKHYNWLFYDKEKLFSCVFVHFLKIKIQKRSTERDNRSSLFSLCVNTFKWINAQTLQIRTEGAIETQSLTSWKTLFKCSRLYSMRF